jgi:hypothetical protein
VAHTRRLESVESKCGAVTLGWGLHPLESAALSRRTREADIAERDRRRLNWAESTPTGVASRKSGVRSHSRHPITSAR